MHGVAAPALPLIEALALRRSAPARRSCGRPRARYARRSSDRRARRAARRRRRRCAAVPVSPDTTTRAAFARPKRSVMRGLRRDLGGASRCRHHRLGARLSRRAPRSPRTAARDRARMRAASAPKRSAGHCLLGHARAGIEQREAAGTVPRDHLRAAATRPAGPAETRARPASAPTAATIASALCDHVHGGRRGPACRCRTNRASGSRRCVARQSERAPRTGQPGQHGRLDQPLDVERHVVPRRAAAPGWSTSSSAFGPRGSTAITRSTPRTIRTTPA